MADIQAHKVSEACESRSSEDTSKEISASNLRVSLHVPFDHVKFIIQSQISFSNATSVYEK